LIRSFIFSDEIHRILPSFGIGRNGNRGYQSRIG